VGDHFGLGVSTSQAQKQSTKDSMHREENLENLRREGSGQIEEPQKKIQLRREGEDWRFESMSERSWKFLAVGLWRLEKRITSHM